jgi:hypothetical protein
MATTSKRPDPTIVVGAVFVFSGIALLAASRGVGIAMIVLGGVLIAAGVAATRKTDSADDRGSGAKDVLKIPPFPTLKWDQFFWVGELVLPSWKGFQSRRGPYGSISSDKPSDGSTRLSIKPVDSEERTIPTPAQTSAFQHLLSNERVVAANVMKGLMDYCTGDEVDFGGPPPVVNDSNDMRRLVGLHSVHVLKVERDGSAYVGFEFGCEWDEEHGAGVMTHLGKVVQTGQADVSFEDWIAKKDAER